MERLSRKKVRLKKAGTEDASPTHETSEATVGRLEVQIVDEKERQPINIQK